jgi:hypothetical protein
MKMQFKETNMRKKMQDERNQDDLPTYLGSWDPKDQVLKVLGKIVQPVQPFDHLIKVSPQVKSCSLSTLHICNLRASIHHLLSYPQNGDNIWLLLGDMCSS